MVPKGVPGWTSPVSTRRLRLGNPNKVRVFVLQSIFPQPTVEALAMPNNSINARNPLLITDLFECVLECLITPPPQRPSKEERRILAVLARTCRTFSEPSLNLLWRRLNSLLHLVRCFSDVADEARVKVVKSFPGPCE